MRGYLTLAAAAATAVLAVALVSQSRSRGATIATPSDIAATVVPGASATLGTIQGAPLGAQSLRISLPDSVAVAPPGAGPPTSDSGTAAQYASAGWLAALIAADVADGVPSLTQYVATDQQGQQPTGADYYWQGGVRLQPGDTPWAHMTKLDTVTATAAAQQLKDNLAVLQGGLGAGEIEQATVTQVSVEPGRSRFAFDVELRVKDLQALTDHFGDIFNGLATGLAPGEDSTIEGLAIHVVDDAGLHAGSWMATRAQTGISVFDSRLTVPPVMTPTLAFTNETGGPSASASAHGGPQASGKPSIVARSRSHHVRARADYVDCGAHGCIGHVAPKPSGRLPIHRTGILRLDTLAAASSVHVSVRSRAQLSGVIADGDARHLPKSTRRWRFRLPRQLAGVVAVEVDVSYANHTGATFYIGVRIAP